MEEPGTPGSARQFFLIDDLEDGNLYFGPVLGANGGWYMASNNSPNVFPADSCVESSPAMTLGGHASAYAMHAYGNGDFPWAQLGVGLHGGPPGCHLLPADASAMTGVSFWAKGTTVQQQVSFEVGTTDNMPPENDGECLSNCYHYYTATVTLDDNWHEYLVPFALLQGGTVPFRAEALLNLIWQAGGESQTPCFDFWIDDVAFFKD